MSKLVHFLPFHFFQPRFIDILSLAQRKWSEKVQKENRGIATSHKWISEAHTAHYLKPQRRSTSNELKLGQCCVCRFTFFHLLSRSLARQTHFVACSASDFRSINFYFFLNKNNRKFHSREQEEKEEIESENSINLEWVFSWIFLSWLALFFLFLTPSRCANSFQFAF